MLQPSSTSRHGRGYSRESTPTSNTFAPSFIKTEEARKQPNADAVRGIEGENDFSGKRYVWIKDPQTAFLKGWVVEELGGNRILVQCDDGTVWQPKLPVLSSVFECCFCFVLSYFVSFYLVQQRADGMNV